MADKFEGRGGLTLSAKVAGTLCGIVCDYRILNMQ